MINSSTEEREFSAIVHSSSDKVVQVSFQTQAMNSNDVDTGWGIINHSTTLRKFMNEKLVDYIAIYNSRELLLHSHE